MRHLDSLYTQYYNRKYKKAQGQVPTTVNETINNTKLIPRNYHGISQAISF